MFRYQCYVCSVVDPDPHCFLSAESRFGSKRAKLTHNTRKSEEINVLTYCAGGFPVAGTSFMEA